MLPNAWELLLTSLPRPIIPCYPTGFTSSAIGSSMRDPAVSWRRCAVVGSRHDRQGVSRTLPVSREAGSAHGLSNLSAAGVADWVRQRGECQQTGDASPAQRRRDAVGACPRQSNAGPTHCCLECALGRIMASGKKREGSPADAALPAAGVCSVGSVHHPCHDPVGALSPSNSFASPATAPPSNSSCDLARHTRVPRLIIRGSGQSSLPPNAVQKYDAHPTRLPDLTT